MDKSTIDESYTSPQKKIKKKKYPFISRRETTQQTPSKLKPINLLFEQYQPRQPQLNRRTGGLLGIEKKYLDTSYALANLTAPTDMSGMEINPTTGCTGCLSAPPTGNAFNTRDGAKIQVKSVLVKGVIVVIPQINQASLDTACIVNISLVMDRQTNGATLDSESVYSNLSANATQNCNALRNPSFVERFKVLKNVSFTLPQLTAAFDSANIEVAGTTIAFTISKKLDMPVKFTTGSTTADVANVIDNSLHIIAWVNNTSYAAQLGFNARIRFYG